MKFRLVIILVFIFLSAAGQEPLIPELTKQDSVARTTERQLMYHQLLSGTLPSGEIMEPFQFPEFDFKNDLTRFRNYDFSEFSLKPLLFTRFQPDHFGLSHSPFFRNESVFSGFDYKVNDRFFIGGYSYGANSIFTAPFPNQGLNNFDLRGSTLFMQYNVSKNLKIGTRINVIQSPGY